MTLDTVWYPNTVFFPFACHNFPFMRILLYEHRHIFDGDFPILLVLCGAEDRYEMDRLESSRLHNEVMMRFDQLRGSSNGVRWKLQMPPGLRWCSPNGGGFQPGPVEMV